MFQVCTKLGLLGTILLAEEGINCSISGSHESIEEFIKFLESDSRLKGKIFPQLMEASFVPFEKMKVKLKHELVGLKLKNEITDMEVKHRLVIPEEWNHTINDPNTVILDVRNNYETNLGKFKNAIVPDTNNFREFPEWFDDWQKKVDRKQAMAIYCTGGVRCAKVLSYMENLGFTKIYQLKWGIINYLKVFKDSMQDSLWTGECFVFDNRASLDHLCAPTSLLWCNTCMREIDKTQARVVSKSSVQCMECKRAQKQDVSSATIDHH